jgi:hypothetical protein
MKIYILDRAEEDLFEGYRFYEGQSPGLGTYFLNCIYSDIESLLLYAGIHRTVHKNYRRLLSERFPFAIYYNVSEETINIYAIVDCRREPGWIRDRLDS